MNRDPAKRRIARDGVRLRRPVDGCSFTLRRGRRHQKRETP